MAATTPPGEEADADPDRRASVDEDDVGAPAEKEKDGPERRKAAATEAEAEAEAGSDEGADAEDAAADDVGPSDEREVGEKTSANAGDGPGPPSAAVRTNEVHPGDGRMGAAAAAEAEAAAPPAPPPFSPGHRDAAPAIPVDPRTRTCAPAFQGVAVAVSRRPGLAIAVSRRRGPPRPPPAREEYGDGATRAAGEGARAEKEADADADAGGGSGGGRSRKRARLSSASRGGKMATGEDMAGGGAEGFGSAAEDGAISAATLSALGAARERAWSIVAVAERLHGGSFAFAHFAGAFATVVQREAALVRAEAARIAEIVDGIVPPPAPVPAPAAGGADAPPSDAERAGTGFEYMLSNLAEFKRVHGHCRVPSKERSRDGRRLGSWVHNQRCFYKRFKQVGGSKRAGGFKRYELGGMNEERITALEKMGFEWEISRGDAIRVSKEDAWDEMYGQLVAFKEKNGHCRVPINQYRFSKDSNPKLAQWVSKQRREYKRMQEGKTNGIWDRRKEKLEEIGFDWVLNLDLYNREKYDTDWRVMFEQMRDFSEKNGHCRVPHKGGMVKLSRWVATQRIQHKKRQAGERTSLSDEKVAELESIGFEWSVPQGRAPGKSDDPEWDALYDRLRDYKRENGTCRIPFAAHGEHYQLHRWISKQKAKIRKLEKLGLLTPEQNESEGDACGADHSPNSGSIPFSERWEIMFSELREFSLRHGHCRVSIGNDHANYSRLSGWVATQRKEWRKMQMGKKSSMTEEKVRRLEELGFDFAPSRGGVKRSRSPRQSEGEEADSS